MVTRHRSCRTGMAACVTLAIGMAVLATSGRSGRADAQAGGPYFPDRFDWQRAKPEEVGMNAARLAEVAPFALANENPATEGPAPGPGDELRCPRAVRHIRSVRCSERGGANGLVIRHGYLVAEWGDTPRVDMTHSVTKTFLSTVVGLAWQRGLIRDVNDRVARLRTDARASSTVRTTRRSPGTTCCGRRATGRGRSGASPTGRIVRKATGQRTGRTGRFTSRARATSTTTSRVNLLALAALHVWRRPLPEVLREEVMEPIGASSTWRWHGYENSWIELDGQRMQSVSGGGHWGGGMFINALGHGALRLPVPPQRPLEGPADRLARSGSRWRARPARPTPSTAT